jgi:hypothetical protein
MKPDLLGNFLDKNLLRSVFCLPNKTRITLQHNTEISVSEHPYTNDMHLEIFSNKGDEAAATLVAMATVVHALQPHDRWFLFVR